MPALRLVEHGGREAAGAAAGDGPGDGAAEEVRGESMSELNEKVKTAIDRLKAFEPKNGEGYYLAFSGGKDSVVCKALLEMAGVKYDATYRVTSVDPPELVQFIKAKHPDVRRDIPHDKDGQPITMWNLIPRKLMPPTQIARYCCQELKESGGDGRITVTGVRWAESVRRAESHGIVTIADRKARREFDGNDSFRITKSGGYVLTNDNAESRLMVEHCYKHRRTTLNPIIDWEDSDVWNFIRGESIPCCELYKEGFHRLGCIGCPMAKTQGREREFLRWPKYKMAYLRAFDKMLERRRERHAADPTRPVWRQNGHDIVDATPMDVFRWWMEYDVLPGQIDLFEEEE